MGKSCLLLRFANDSFTAAYITTIGIDFKIKNLTIDNQKIKLQVWDTAGQERFRTITTAYYRGAGGILLVYDVTEEESFLDVGNWMEQIDTHASPKVKRILVANKADKDEVDRVVSNERGVEMAAQYGIPYFECSAKDNKNVEEAFVQISRDILADMALSGEGADKAESGMKLGNDDANASKGGCC